MTEKHRGILGWPLLFLVLVGLSLGLSFAAPAEADFGFDDLEVGFTAEDGSAAVQAGSHPLAWTIDLKMNTIPGPDESIPDEDLKNLRIVFPGGLIGTPAFLPRCSQLEFSFEDCPAETAVGTVAVSTNRPEDGDDVPLYNLMPQEGSPAELAFVALHLPVRLKVALEPDPPYRMVASLTNVSQADAFFGAEISIEGRPRGTPLLTLPRSCGGPLETSFEAESWQRPGTWTAPAIVETPGSPDPPWGLSGCDQLQFDPTVDASTTTSAARAPSGLDFTLSAPDPGLADAKGLARADLDRVVLRLPEGMTANASAAAGLRACTPSDFAAVALDGPAGSGCPDASKIGTATVLTPVLDEPVQGSVYVAQPDDPATAAPGAENPFDSLLALYLVLENPRLGVLLKEAMEVRADPASGRLTASIDEIPQLPISSLELHLREGPRGPLVTPSACGSHAIRSELTPSSGAAPLPGESRFILDRGCAAGGFAPRLLAGSRSIRAGADTAFQVRVSRSDAEEDLAAVALTLPRGVVADFASVPLCPDQAAPAGDCPAGSRIGSIDVVAGRGAMPLPVPAQDSPPGRVYLAGPYEEAPFSLIADVPARAGPFDLGTVVLRAPIEIDRRTAQASIRFGGLPQILDGIPISYRAIRVLLDRPGFLRNPTSCAVASVGGSAISSTGARSSLASRFQVGGCGSLAFRPKVSVRLLGPTHRGAHPRVRAVIRGREGDAGIRRVTATLPSTELLDSRGIGAVCSATQFDAGDCPAESIRGRATVWTPLLDHPLSGPVFLRSSGGKLPDLAGRLGGDIPLELVAHVDSRRGRLRLAFAGIPDVPLTKVVVALQGGRNGILVNGGGVCAGRHVVAAGLTAHNGRRYVGAPVLRTDC